MVLASGNVLVIIGNGLVVFWGCFGSVFVVLASGNVLVIIGNDLVVFWGCFRGFGLR